VRSIPELLAPAGDWATLRAAFDAGADAVFFGVRGFNMRAAARNFTARDLPRIAAEAHARGRRAYLAVNVLVFERELPRLQRLLSAAARAGVDGIIASDLAVIAAGRAAGLEVHASTQMSVANSAAMEVLIGLGVRRFVLARECGLAEIRRLRSSLRRRLGARAAAGIHLEVFAHGAMCVSVSGRCFMSEHECGKSANRGECTQPCRREYRVVAERGDSEWVVGKDYILSPKDLCTIPFLEKLVAAGADSLKIEGRLRSPEYVAIVVGAYRRLLDFMRERRGKRGFAADFAQLKQECLARVSEVYNRGFSSGFYHGKPVGEWTHTQGSEATKRRYHVGVVINYFRKPRIAHVRVLDSAFAGGDELIIEGPTTGFVLQKAGALLLDGQPVPRAERGMEVTFPAEQLVREGDKVYVLR